MNGQREREYSGSQRLKVNLIMGGWELVRRCEQDGKWVGKIRL
jgi:hypothetical protein